MVSLPRAIHLIQLIQALRAGGVKLGIGSALAANAALAAVDVGSRAQARAALRATLIHDPAQFEFFEQLFDALFPAGTRTPPDPFGEPMVSMSNAAPPPLLTRRLAESLASLRPNEVVREPDRRERVATGTESSEERLASKDFEQMSATELAVARRLIAALKCRGPRRLSRRWEAGGVGTRLDLKRMMRHRPLEKPLLHARQRRLRDWVLLVDISGSMSVYSRMFLLFAHAISGGGGRVETFVFATRLTRITRELRQLDADAALLASTRRVLDWDGGTLLSESLAEFNLAWARRVLGRGAQVLLLTDGLERGGLERLDPEVRRLVRACHELIWINPLRRHPGYQPLAAGAGILARHAHRCASAHNVTSMLELLDLLE